MNGAYQYSWAPPSYNPTIYVKPPTMQPVRLGDVFALEIWMKDVSPDWSITAVQFSLMWNTTFIVPALGPNGTYYDQGAFFETYEYYQGGLTYAADINSHDHPPPLTPLPDDYNYSTFGVLLLPDFPPNPQYHPPFLSGEGRVITVYFQAVLETVFPTEAYTWIDFISEDTYAVDIFSINVLVSSVGCLYRAPVTLIIPEHDLAVTDVTVSKSIIGQGYFADVNVTLVNEGNFAEYFNITVYANGSQIARQENITLESGISATLTLSWNTTDFGLGNFTLWAYAEPVSGETNTDDNNFTLPALVGVTFAGDVTGVSGTPDWKVNMRDIGVICGKFSKSPVSPGWDPNIDIDGDDIVNMRDIGIACTNFGQHYP